HEPGRRAARDRRASGPPLVHRRPVPPGAEIQALRPPPVVRQLHRRGGETEPAGMIAPALLGLLLVTQAVGQGPEHFFVGRTESTGTASIMMRGSHAVRDQGRGRIERGNVLILDQTIHEAGRPARSRTWRLVRTP